MPSENTEHYDFCLPSWTTLEEMRDVRVSLPAWGHIVDQDTGEQHRYDPDRIAPHLQNSILDFVANTPRDEDGYNKWLLVVGSRQTGKSACTTLATYMKTAYHPGTYAAVIADNKDRTEDLFRHINMCHELMDERVRARTISCRESRQLSFEHQAKIRTLTAGSSMVGIGRSVDFLHLSEACFWEDYAGVWSAMRPALVNRRNAVIIKECTPSTMDMPSAEAYRDEAYDARKGIGRSEFLFAPFYSSSLCERRWDKSQILDAKETLLIEKHGPFSPDFASHLLAWMVSTNGKGGDPMYASSVPWITYLNLAFRRQEISSDKKIRRNPELFEVWYPSDPITCWVVPGGAAIPSQALLRHERSILTPWRPPDGCYQEYANPKPGARYVLAADPAGFGMSGDEASFVVLECWIDSIEVVAEYSTARSNTIEFAHKICQVAKRYNDAFTAVESNGVGMGALSILAMASEKTGTVLVTPMGEEVRVHIKNLVWSGKNDNQVPGIPSSAGYKKASMAYLVDALLDTLVLRSEALFEQLRTYKRDKEVEDSEQTKILNPGTVGKKRRAKHHWDRVSALMLGVWYIRKNPGLLRYKAPTAEEAAAETEAAEERHKATDAVPIDEWSSEDQQAFHKEGRKRSRAKYKNRKRRTPRGRVR